MITRPTTECVGSRARCHEGLFDIDGKTIQLEEEELRTQDPGFQGEDAAGERLREKVRN